MSTGLKVFLWIGGVIAALVAIVIIAGIYIGKSVMADVQAAAEFAKNATHDQCVDEVARRIKSCDGVKCTVQTSVFGGTCLSEAKGDAAQFCAAVPGIADRDGITKWRGGFCESRDLEQQACEVITGLVVVTCDSGDDEESSSESSSSSDADSATGRQ